MKDNEIKTGTRIRFAAKVNYIGKRGSGSVSGYWTIWETRKSANGWSDPAPAHINYSDDDLLKYRGTLWNWYERELGDSDTLIPMRVSVCPRCEGVMLDVPSASAACWKCRMYGGAE